MSEPCDLSAADARAEIGRRRLSPVELLDSCIDRIERLNPLLNAIVNPCFERARDEAKIAEAAVAKGDPLGKLRGLPLGVKDLNDLAGVKTTQGSPLFADYVPEHDDNIVAAMRAEAQSPWGKQTFPSMDSVQPRTIRCSERRGILTTPRVPLAPPRAAALAARMVPLAMGSDFAGSLRTPAAYCGIFGMRPSSGAVASAQHGFGWSPFDFEGPLARTAADAKLLMSAMMTNDSRDPLGRPADPSFANPAREVDLAQIRVAVSEDLGLAPMSREVRDGFRRKVSRFTGLFPASTKRILKCAMPVGPSTCCVASVSSMISGESARKTLMLWGRPSSMSLIAPKRLA